MKVLLQRVSQAKVTVDQKIIGQISRGLVIFVGFKNGDTNTSIDQLAHKLLNLRLFPQDNFPLNQSILDIQGQILVISQFTLYADLKGRRPSFTQALAPKEAKQLYQYFISKLQESQLSIAAGQFGAHMHVSLINDGPVTILLEN